MYSTGVVDLLNLIFDDFSESIFSQLLIDGHTVSARLPVNDSLFKECSGVQSFICSRIFHAGIKYYAEFSSTPSQRCSVVNLSTIHCIYLSMNTINTE